MRVRGPVRHLFIALLASALLPGTWACASGGPSRGGGSGSVRIRIVNQTVSDVTISIMREETPIRLGRVESQGVRVFVANRAIVGSAGLLLLRAETTSTGRQVASSPPFAVDPGQSVEWTLRDGVEMASTLIVR